MKNFDKKHIVYLAIALVVVAFLASYLKKDGANVNKETLANDAVLVLPEKEIYVEIADSNSERQKGLSGKKYILDDEGMLFVFKTSGEYSFWMKDMNFPLDIIWISEDGYVVHKVGNVSSSTYPQIFTNSIPAKYVLEINGNLSDNYGIFVGSKVDLRDIIK